jgi:uncharacterized protein (DUF885 family)
MKIRNLAAALILTAAVTSAALAADTSNQPAASPAASPTQQLHRLFDDYWETQLRESPSYATMVGDKRYNDRLDDLSPEAIARRRRENEDFLHQLEAIDAASLAETDRVSRSVLQYVLRMNVTGARLMGDVPLEFGMGESPTPVNPMDGPQFALPVLAASTEFTKLRDYDDYLKRLDALPVYVAQLSQQLETGMSTGWTPPRITLRNVPSQFEPLADSDPPRNALFAPFNSFPPDLSENDRTRLRKAGETAIRDRVAPAFARLKAFIEQRYMPAAREEIAASKLPGGPAYYAAALAINNTTRLSPQEIHDLGLREVARIESEMQAVQKQIGFAGSRGDFLNYLRSDPKFFFESAQAMLGTYRDIAKRIDPLLPTLFRELPRLPYGIRPMRKEEGDNAEHYTPGAADGSRAGYFEANTNNLRRLARWEMTTLVLHETVPGHHLQISRAQELKDLPMFRRNIIFDGYAEGWALYSETLGDLIGMYDDPLDKYGHLGDALLRATRLVVDTGMHALGWNRDRAIRYMKEHTTLSDDEVVSEVDRYIVWPGQATAYKIGQLRIVALRDKAKAALGERFDLRAFHNAVIDGGAMPLEVLDEQIDRWIAAQKATK